MMQTKKANIIFDLDGTLIDSSERLYNLFQDLVPESLLTKEEYWNLKRNMVSHKMILEKYFPSRSYEIFNNRWMKLIEKDLYLNMDKNYPDTIDILKRLSSAYNIVLLTARQSERGLSFELERLKIRDYFHKVLVTEGKSTKGILLEKELTNGTLLKSNEDVFVGDTGKDIQIGNSAGYKTVAITHGFISRETLCQYNPDILIDELSELLQIHSLVLHTKN